MKQRLKIYNGKLITPQGLVAGGTVIVDGDRIVSVSKENDDVESMSHLDSLIYMYTGAVVMILWMEQKLHF